MKEMLLWPKRTRIRNDGRRQWYEVRGDGAIVCEIGAFSKIIEGIPNETKVVTIEYHSRSDTIDPNFQVSSELKPTLKNVYPQEGGFLSLAFDGDNISSSGFSNVYNDIYESGDKNAYAFYKISELGGITGKFVTILNLIISGDTYDGFNFKTDGQMKTEILSDQTKVINWIKHRELRIKVIGTGATYFSVEVNAKRTKKENDSGHGYVDGLHAGIFFESFTFEPLYADDFSETGGADINPIHKIREILTDDTAMAKPEADVNDQNFMKAADRIWNESLGISWAIDEKSCIDAIEELCYHIEAGIRVNRQTGLYEMVLFRDDWFAENEIHSIAENKIKDLSLEVMNSDDIVNQLNVTYYDRERIKNSTFSIYENGSILTMGKANAESIDFPYFMNMRNAEVVANWKLKQYSTPAWKGTLTTGWREARKWNRYDLVKINWSKKWQGTILARIMKIDLGNGLNNEVMIDFEEVVPYSGEMNTSIVVDTPIDAGSQPPQPSVNAAFEAPYYLTVLRAGQANADLELSSNPDIGYVVAIAAKPQNNSLNALLFTDGGVGEFEQVSRLDYCDILQLDQPIIETTSSFTVTGSLTQAANTSNLILVNGELMGFLSFDDETKVLSVKRGVLDTVPKKHNGGSLFIFDLPDVAFDSTQYAQSEVIDTQVLTTTPSGIQDLLGYGQAIEIQSRAIRPYPPANVKLNNAYYPETIIATSDIVLTWDSRNRLQQTGGSVIGFFDPSLTPEGGVTYAYELISENVVLDSMTGISTNTALILSSVLIPNKPHTLRLWSVRDGYESY